jgi:hypothetical protein
LCVFVTEVLGGGGRERLVKQRATPPTPPSNPSCGWSVCQSVRVLKPRFRLSVCRGPETQILTVRLSRSWNLDPVCPSVEVLKPRFHLSVCRGPETQIPSVRLSRSWNPDLIYPFVEVLKLRSRLSVCRSLETQIPNCKSKIKYFITGIHRQNNNKSY